MVQVMVVGYLLAAAAFTSLAWVRFARGDLGGARRASWMGGVCWLAGLIQFVPVAGLDVALRVLREVVSPGLLLLLLLGFGVRR